jgi:hypothetical protein
MQPERIKIYIDGGNTYKALFTDYISTKDNSVTPRIVPKGSKFNYQDFALFLANGRNLCGKGYYWRIS